jgi:hypothetical protein
MTKLTLFIVSLVLFANQLWAQQYGNLTKVPVAISFFHPLSTNGARAGECVNQLSINLISGYSAGLAGFEFGGIMNTERDFVHGAQFAGIGNFVAGEFTGFQFAGIGNFNRGISHGFQFAGVGNFNYDQADGILAAGIFNFTNGKSLALQFAGIGNFCQDIEGLQAAGIANVVKGNGKAIQLSGVANVTLGEVNGLQAAGILNISEKKMQNAQISGVINASLEDAEGIQIAGISNITRGNLTGAQISGILNVAKNIDGFQIGLVNVGDTLKSGMPIGLLSIVKNGFREMEISVGEGFNAQAAFKIGVDKFYNIFAIGAQVFGPDYSWAFGYGIGTHLMKNDRFKTQLELMSFHINEGKAWIDQENNLQQVKVSFTRKMSKHLSIFAGPTANLMISKTTDDHDQPFTSRFAPYEIVSHHGKNTTLQSWIGLTAGIHLN